MRTESKTEINWADSGSGKANGQSGRGKEQRSGRSQINNRSAGRAGSLGWSAVKPPFFFSDESRVNELASFSSDLFF